MSGGSPEGPNGLLLVEKPAGITSHDAVDRVRRALGIRKVGHAGTLDPMATGLLLIGVGRATRLLRFLGDLPKVYEGTGLLGVETATLDAAGEVVARAGVDTVTEEALREVSRAIQDQRWLLLEMKRETLGLEEIFLSLVHEEKGMRSVPGSR